MPQKCESVGHISSIIGKLFAKRGAWTLFRGIWTYRVKVIELQSFYKLKN